MVRWLDEKIEAVIRDYFATAANRSCCVPGVAAARRHDVAA